MNDRFIDIELPPGLAERFRLFCRASGRERDEVLLAAILAYAEVRPEGSDPGGDVVRMRLVDADERR